MLAGDIGRVKTEPAGIPNGLAQLESTQQRDKRIADLESQLHKLEMEHEVCIVKRISVADTGFQAAEGGGGGNL